MATVMKETAPDLSDRKSSYEYDDLIKSGHGELFGADNGRLPLPPMLMLDRIPYISAEGGAYDKGELRAELDIKPDLWFFDCHFEGDPVMPGCLGLDALWQLVGFHLVWLGHKGRGRALGVVVAGHLGRAAGGQIGVGAVVVGGVVHRAAGALVEIADLDRGELGTELLPVPSHGVLQRPAA